MSNILMLSAHATRIDRRIVAEANALADSGRSVTLVSVPAAVEQGLLDGRVELVLCSSQDLQGLGWRRRFVEKGKTLLKAWPWFYQVQKRLYRASGGWKRAGAAEVLVRRCPTAAYDVIHCHDLDTLPAAVQLKREIAPGAKIIYDSHELWPYQVKDKAFQEYWKGVETSLIGQTDRVITVNDSIARQMVEFYAIAMPAVVYNSHEAAGPPAAVTGEEFLGHFAVPKGGLNVLYQGNIGPERNLENLVAAFAELGTDVRLLMLGEGELARSLKAACARKGIANVFFAPPVSQTRLLGFTRLADMGIIPYTDDGILNNRFCTPNKLFEFIAAGVPVCASDLPELRKIVKDQGIGEVYPMGSARQIASAVEDCLSRRQKGEFTAASMQAAQEKYSWVRQRQALLKVYQELGV
ncbi:MAG: glycosyltransferase family 4 protein [Planctomycetaceae bacterium]|nr:glycosyltransferase family 4 protein [Planctomycetaceae bacterium]